MGCLAFRCTVNKTMVRTSARGKALVETASHRNIKFSLGFFPLPVCPHGGAVGPRTSLHVLFPDMDKWRRASSLCMCKLSTEMECKCSVGASGMTHPAIVNFLFQIPPPPPPSTHPPLTSSLPAFMYFVFFASSFPRREDQMTGSRGRQKGFAAFGEQTNLFPRAQHRLHLRAHHRAPLEPLKPAFPNMKEGKPKQREMRWKAGSRGEGRLIRLFWGITRRGFFLEDYRVLFVPQRSDVQKRGRVLYFIAVISRWASSLSAHNQTTRPKRGQMRNEEETIASGERRRS